MACASHWDLKALPPGTPSCAVGMRNCDPSTSKYSHHKRLDNAHGPESHQSVQSVNSLATHPQSFHMANLPKCDHPCYSCRLERSESNSDFIHLSSSKSARNTCFPAVFTTQYGKRYVLTHLSRYFACPGRFFNQNALRVCGSFIPPKILMKNP